MAAYIRRQLFLVSFFVATDNTSNEGKKYLCSQASRTLRISTPYQRRHTHQTQKGTVQGRSTIDSLPVADRNPTDPNGNRCYRPDTNNTCGIPTDSTMASTPTGTQNCHAIDQPAYQTLTDLVTHSCVQCAGQPARYGTRSCLQIIVVTRPRTRRQSLSPALCRLLCRTTGTRPLPCGGRLVKAAGGWNAIFGET